MGITADRGKIPNGLLPDVALSGLRMGFPDAARGLISLCRPLDCSSRFHRTKRHKSRDRRSWRSSRRKAKPRRSRDRAHRNHNHNVHRAWLRSRICTSIARTRTLNCPQSRSRSNQAPPLGTGTIVSAKLAGRSAARTATGRDGRI